MGIGNANNQGRPVYANWHEAQAARIRAEQEAERAASPADFARHAVNDDPKHLNVGALQSVQGGNLRAALAQIPGLDAKTVARVTPGEREQLREAVGYSTERLAKELGLPVRTVEGYENGADPCDPLGMGQNYVKFLRLAADQAQNT